MTEIEVTLVKVFSPQGKLLSMWPTNEHFNGDGFDYKKHIRETRCKEIMERHPEIKQVEHLQIDINVKPLH